MTWLTRASDAKTPFEAALGNQPELLRLYRSFLGTLFDEDLLPLRLLELCRRKIAELHGCEAELAVECTGVELGGELSPVEERCLAVAAKLVREHHCITDAEVEALRQDLSEPGVVALLTAAAMFDANCRLKLVLEVDVKPQSVERVASSDGQLY